MIELRPVQFCSDDLNGLNGLNFLNEKFPVCCQRSQVQAFRQATTIDYYCLMNRCTGMLPSSKRGSYGMPSRMRSR